MKYADVHFRKPFLALFIASSIVATGCGNNDEHTQVTNTETKEAGHRASAGEKNDETVHGGTTQKKVVLSATQIDNAGLEFATAGPAVLGEILPLYGVVAPNAERVRDVGARYAGTIRRVEKKVGDSVRQGETLATVESNESLQTYSVTAPQAGVVTVRNANPGEQTSNEPLFTIADFSTVWVELSLFPRDVAKVRVGQPVRVKSADAGIETAGTIGYVAPFGSSANQTLTARVVLNNPEHTWAPGLYVTAEVQLSQQTVPLAVYNAALQNIDGATVVFVKQDDGLAPYPVRIGRSDGHYTEVLGGLQPGKTYATTNSFTLKAELTKGEASHDH